MPRFDGDRSIYSTLELNNISLASSGTYRKFKIETNQTIGQNHQTLNHLFIQQDMSITSPSLPDEKISDFCGALAS